MTENKNILNPLSILCLDLDYQIKLKTEANLLLPNIVKTNYDDMYKMERHPMFMH